MISDRIKDMADSETLRISAIARDLKDRGMDVVDFGLGQPDFPPPEGLKAAALRAALEGHGGYTDVAGIFELRQAIADKLRKENGVNYTPNEVVVSSGAKQSLFNIFHAVVNHGDDVIIPRPYWVSYPEMARLAGGTPVYAETDEDFRLRADLVAEASTEKSRLLVINSPNNPTGAVYTRAELRRLADIVLEKGMKVVSDEIYEKIIYEEEHVSIASFGEEVRDVCFTVNGFSKSHAIPGWRLGYVACPERFAKAMKKFQGQSTSNPSSLVQRAAIDGLREPHDMGAMVREFRDRRDFIVHNLNEIEGIECPLPGGAFYVLPKIPSEDSSGFCERLIQKAGVAAVPGSAFGAEGRIRISYATSMDRIELGLKRIWTFCRNNRQ